MSLTLRTKCQPILDEHNLHGFHVDVHREERVLVIVAECGKPLTSIFGIRFSRTAPSNAEINAAVPLFSEFMIRYNHVVHEMWQARIALRSFPDQPYADMIRFKAKGIPSALLESFQKWEQLSDDNEWAVALANDEVHFYPTAYNTSSERLPLNVVLDFASEHLELFLDRAHQVKVWEEERELLKKAAEEAQAALQACDI
jgi:hypothetical protein